MTQDSVHPGHMEYIIVPVFPMKTARVREAK